MMMKALRACLIGLLTGLSCSYALLTIGVMIKPGALLTGDDLLLQFIIAAVMGVVIGFGSLIFETSFCSLPIQLVIHFAYVNLCAFIGGYFGSWFTFSDASTLLTVFLTVIIIYALVWFFLLVTTKREVDEINGYLQQRKRHQ